MWWKGSSYNVGVLVLVAAFHFSPELGAREPQEEKKPRNLVVDDYFRLKRVGAPEISPDGNWIAYTISEANLKEDKWETRIWMSSKEGGEPVPMTAKGSSATHPRWSPDGKYLAFLAKLNDKKAQVRILYRHGGDSQQLTDVQQGVEALEWSPDSKKLVLVIRDPTPEDIKAGEAEKEGREYKPPENPRPYVVDRLFFKRDYVGYLDRRRTHLYVFDMESKTMTQVTSGDYDDSDPAWSPNSRFIAFVSNRTEEPDNNYNSDIWVVAANNPDKGKTLRRLTINPGEDTAPAWSLDGKLIAYRSATDVRAIVFGTRHLAVVPATGGEERVLTQELDRWVYSPKFSLDGRYVYFLLEDSGERHLARISVEGGEISRPIGGRRSVRSFDIGTDELVAALISEPLIPGEIFLHQQGNLRQLTTTNETVLSEIRLADVENVHFPSKDGTEIEGFIYMPPASTPNVWYPTVLRIHGGPIAQYDFSFSFDAQLFAANGYVVVMTNPRGSSGYGQPFSMAIFADWGNKDYEDVIAGIDYAISNGYADPERLGVGGWSYGGILTNYVITKTNRFKGAISGASLGLIRANYGHDHYQKWYEYEFGLPWENRELWERLSAFNYIEKIVTPTLFIGGEKDWNVPILNSEQMYQALKRLGRTTQLVVYPNEHHGLRKPSYQKDRWERYLDWYDRYVKDEKPPKKSDK